MNYELAVLKQKELEQKGETGENMLKLLSDLMQIEKKNSSDKLESLEDQLMAVNTEKSTFI